MASSTLARVEDTFDFKAPDYAAIFRARVERLARLRANPGAFAALKLWYKHNPADFINDWGCTFEVRNPERGLPALIPFILFPKQRAWVEFIMRKWQNRERGLTEKSRDCGVSWLSVALGATLCLFWDGINIGFGSRKEEYIDKLGAPKALFVRARQFLRYLPHEFLGGWEERKHAPHMRIMFPGTGSTMSGEAGDGIGRGDRASIYFVDEAAFLERPQLTEASLSQATNCRQDISTPKGMGNPFAQLRHGGKVEVFTFHWRDDPRKDQAWYDKQVSEAVSPAVVAQEIDLSYTASVEGVLIPSAWVQAAIDAHIKLNIVPSGAFVGALDIADEGMDKCAFAGGHGILLSFLEEWSGKDSDTFYSTQRAFRICDEQGFPDFLYDADGMGAGVRGDSRVINEQRLDRQQTQIGVSPFRGSGEVLRPDSEDIKGRKNKDYFLNFKAQSYWSLRDRFKTTFRAVTQGEPFDPDLIISLDSCLPLLSQLTMELSQPIYKENSVGKLLVDKKPEGTKSPNLADAVMMRFSGARRPMRISSEVLNSI